VKYVLRILPSVESVESGDRKSADTDGGEINFQKNSKNF
jgi:hypothetical protein